MEKSRVVLSFLWVALMLTYLLGDVLRIFAGDFEPGKLSGKGGTQWMWLLIAVIMMVPIAMVILNLFVSYPVIRWINIGVSLFWVIFNLMGLPYPGMYDNFLIGVSFVINFMTILYAWRWS